MYPQYDNNKNTHINLKINKNLKNEMEIEYPSSLYNQRVRTVSDSGSPYMEINSDFTKLISPALSL
jgi:hypothetical protein